MHSTRVRAQVIRPHTVALVESCLTGLQSAADPSALLRVLRYVFRSFHHTKIEPLLREFAPLLPHAVHALLTMLEAPDEHGFQDALVELCLRMPARLSALLPYLPRLMKVGCNDRRARLSPRGAVAETCGADV